MFNKLMWVWLVMCPHTFGHLMANHHSNHFFLLFGMQLLFIDSIILSKSFILVRVMVTREYTLDGDTVYCTLIHLGMA